MVQEAKLIAEVVTADAESFSGSYLSDYWPPKPNSPAAWADNAVLMLAYQEAALAVQAHNGGLKARMLDVSTGPTLAPLLAMMSSVSEVQLSDYNEGNRSTLRSLPIQYWSEYVPMLVRSYDNPHSRIGAILSELDALRMAHLPVPVDVFKDPPFPDHINPFDYNLISMQFVADSVTDNLADYLRCLGRVTDMVKPGAFFIMSAIVDSEGWALGVDSRPSPKVSERVVEDFLKSQGMTLLYKGRSIRFPDLSYSGGWVVVAAVRS